MCSPTCLWNSLIWEPVRRGNETSVVWLLSEERLLGTPALCSTCPSITCLIVRSRPFRDKDDLLSNLKPMFSHFQNIKARFVNSDIFQRHCSAVGLCVMTCSPCGIILLWDHGLFQTNRLLSRRRLPCLSCKNDTPLLPIMLVLLFSLFLCSSYYYYLITSIRTNMFVYFFAVSVDRR